VQLYLKSVAEEIERLNLENGQLREEAGQLRDELAEMRGREKTLQETLVSAQRMSEDLKERGRREAELTVHEARLRAEDLMRVSREQLGQLETDVARLHAERETLEGRLRGVIEQHLALLEMSREARTGLDNVRVMPPRAGADLG
jgi:cell division initiation protein